MTDNGRRHPGIPSHIGRLSPPLTKTHSESLKLKYERFFGGKVPPIRDWTVGLKIVGMKMLAMKLLGKHYGTDAKL